MPKQIYRRRHLREIFGSDYMIAQLTEDGILEPAIQPKGRKGYWNERQIQAAQRKIYELKNPKIDLTAPRGKTRPLCARHVAQIRAHAIANGLITPREF